MSSQNTPAELESLLERRAFSTVFQPVLDFDARQVLGFEATTRGAINSPLHNPLTLFEEGARWNLLPQLDRTCAELACLRFDELDLPGLLFLNITPVSFAAAELAGVLDRLLQSPVSLTPQRVVIEITEQQRFDETADLRAAVHTFRRLGFKIAVDDLGAGYAGLRSWTELKPDYVKIDRHFIENIDGDATKRDFVRSIIEVGRGLGCRIVAEGIETEGELETIRQLGIGFGQGFILGVPRPVPPITVPQALLQKSEPRHRGGLLTRVSAGALARPCLTVPPSMPTEQVLEHFHADRALTAIPVVDDTRPLGLATRSELLDLFSARYRRELHGRKPISAFMRTGAVCVDENTPLEEISRLITDDTEQDLAQVFMVTRHGSFFGVARTSLLLRRITEQQLHLARHSNPLTQLLGSIPICEQVDSLLTQRAEFHFAYFDLNSFKPYNDLYGYSRGDRIILLLSGILCRNLDPVQDLVGHIGGDDFVAILRSPDWSARCDAILQEFSREVRLHYPAEALEAGGIHCEDRRAQRAFFPLVSLAIGLAHPDPERCHNHHDVVALATDAKREAKRLGGSALFMSARRHPDDLPPPGNGIPLAA